MVHSNYSDTSDSTDECVRRITALFEQIGPNATANLALGRDSAEMPWFQRWRCSILRIGNWASRDSL